MGRADMRLAGSRELSWRRLALCIEQLVADRSSALWRSLAGRDRAEWRLPVILLARAVSALEAANWQRGGGKRKDYPEPVLPPWVDPPGKTTKTFGGSRKSIGDMKKWLGW